MNDFLSSLKIAATGLHAQNARMRVIAENIANADSTAQTAGGNPYRRKVPTFSSALDRTLDARVVTLGRIKPDNSDFRLKYEPGHPAADARGMVKYPNVNSMVEMADMREANRSYEANLQVIKQARDMISMTIDMLRSG